MIICTNQWKIGRLQSAMMGDMPVKTVQNRQCIDNVSDYDSEH